MKYIKANTLSCFSPPVMIATFAIEIALAVYVTWRYKLTNITKLAVSVLFFLAVFQLAEYNVCEGSFGIDSLGWSKLGYIAITMLPPLGLHLATRIAGDKKTTLLAAAYGSAALFAMFFAFSGNGITSSACLGNYVIFKTAPGSHWAYAAYYYGWLTVAVLYCANKIKQQLAPNIIAALQALMVGYLLFMVPTTLVNVIDPSTIAGIPSIMCGFAVLLAIALAGEVVPRYYQQPAITGLLAWGRKSSAHGKTTK
ncbi:MAG: hypothetical protein WAQ25_04220 [Candidatus Saccharimonas sp.]